MKANTQYNDFIGTSAADISDHTDLRKFISSRGIDTEKYEPIGASFYHGYSDFFTASIICIDNEQSTKDKPYIVSLSFEEEFTHEEFFNLFKRFDVVVSRKHDGFQDYEINEEITIDDREENEE
ncbi:MAG: hypothetical protein VB046_08530 [Paludibacter sp.]|nr:hypothetical protein [Paludibacter sp.]